MFCQRLPHTLHSSARDGIRGPFSLATCLEGVYREYVFRCKLLPPRFFYKLRLLKSRTSSLPYPLCKPRHSLDVMLFPVSLPILFALFTWALCVPTASSFWFRSSHNHPVRANRRIRNPSLDVTTQTQTYTPIESVPSSLSGISSYNFSLPTVSVIVPSPASQSMIVTSIIPLYEVCPSPGSNSSSCSTVFSTKITSSCSAVLTYAFSAVTVSDCNQKITFSTQNSYSLATAFATTVTVAPSATGLVNRDIASTTLIPTPSTYVQSVVTYYIAPWQSLIADTPSNITVQICKTDRGQQTCSTITEVWVVVTERVPVTETRDVSISTSFTQVCPPFSLLYTLEL